MSRVTQATFLTEDPERTEQWRDLVPSLRDDSEMVIYRVQIVLDQDYKGWSWWAEVSHQTRTKKGEPSKNATLTRVLLTEQQVETLSGGTLRVP